jgi:putative membrane protein
MSLFDSAGRQRIEAAIRDVESTTAGELVVVTVPRSDAYHAVRLTYAGALAMAVASLVHVLHPTLQVGLLLWLEAAVAVALWAALNVPALLRLVLPAAPAQLRAAQRARIEFLSNRVYDTRDHTGVLIFLSELEHQVVIIGDQGIYERIKADGFQAYVDRVVAAIRAGRAADGVCEVLGDLGKQLAAQFPRRDDDTDELSNTVRERES